MNNLAGIRPVINNQTLLSLLLVNGIIIVLAVSQGWDLGTTIFVYWAQSIIIGFFTVVRILGLRIEDLPSEEIEAIPAALLQVKDRKSSFWTIKIGLAAFFSLHYGLFHYGYLSFLEIFGFVMPGDIRDAGCMVLACGLFFANHLYSFLFYRESERKQGTYVQELFVRPYLRIIPIHITIILGGFLTMIFYAIGRDPSVFILVVFLLVKTLVDAWMHIRKHE